MHLFIIYTSTFIRSSIISDVYIHHLVLLIPFNSYLSNHLVILLTLKSTNRVTYPYIHL